MLRFAVVGSEHCDSGHTCEEKPSLFRFGLISDIQYADFDDRYSCTGKRRYYRAALPSVDRAVAQWNREGVAFAVSCGDIVDGVNRTTKQSDAALDRVLQRLKPLKVECKHVLGNHCTCQFERSHLLERLEFEGKLGYYSFEPIAGWKFVVLDTSDVSLHGWPPGHPNFILAKKVLRAKNPNDNWCNPFLLDGLDRRFVAYNGAVGEAQLEWLRNQLEAAKKLGQRVVVFTHIPINADMVAPGELLWNYDEVQKSLRHYPSVVQAVISGHVHYWGYAKGSDGIHYMTLPGVIEQPPGKEAHGIVDIYDEHLTVTGFGKEKPFIVKYQS